MSPSTATTWTPGTWRTPCWRPRGHRPARSSLGAATARTAEEVVRGLAEVSDVAYRVTKLPAPTGDRLAGVQWQLADTSRARTMLGWSATRPLPETLHRIWLSAGANADRNPYPLRAEGRAR